ncbi:MAG TPA: CYTH and CHAD domain-containing protein, partial [Chloroflexota bacterium]
TWIGATTREGVQHLMTSQVDQLTAGHTQHLSRLEREAKLDAPAEFALPHDCTLIGEVLAGGLEQQRLETVYYDTPDLRLASRGITLRYRNSEGWTLKLPETTRGKALIRTEYRFAGGNQAVPPAAADLVQAVIRGQELGSVKRLRAARSRVRLRDSDQQPLGEIVDDKVSIIENNRAVASFREIEVELADEAPYRLLPRLVKALAKRGAMPAGPISKLLRALGPRAGELHSEASQRTGAKPPIEQLVGSAITVALDEIIRRDPRVRLGSDPEDVQQARAAVRRLRSALRSFAPLLDDEWVRLARTELDWLSAALGAVRDGEVLLSRLQSRIQSLPEEDRQVGRTLIDRLAATTAEKRAELLIVLRSNRYLELLDQLSAASQLPPLKSAPEEGPAAPLKAVNRAWRQLRKTAESLPARPRDSELQALRIRAKRCRYAAESVASLAGRRARRLARRCRRLQAILGEHQDSVVTRAWLRQIAPLASGREAFVAGQIAATEGRAAAGDRPAWRRAWKRLAGSSDKKPYKDLMLS